MSIIKLKNSENKVDFFYFNIKVFIYFKSFVIPVSVAQFEFVRKTYIFL